MGLLRVLTGCVLVSATVGCSEPASTTALPSSGMASSGGQAQASANRAEAETLAVDAIGCVLRGVDSNGERCAQIAALVGVRPAVLARAEHETVEQLGQIVVRRARAERMTAAQRVGIARWFDLGMAAAREAVLAREGSRAAHLTAARANPMTAGDLDAIEFAAARDTAALRARAQLDALRAFAAEGLDGAPEAQALSVLIAMARVDGARGAHEAIRTDAVQSSADLAVDVAGAGSVRALTDRGNSGARSAMRASEGPSLDDAHARLRLRAGEVCERASAVVRAFCRENTER